VTIPLTFGIIKTIFQLLFSITMYDLRCNDKTKSSRDFFGLELDSKTKKVLLDLESLNKKVNYWNVPRSTGIILSSVLTIIGAKNVLEIGTSNGYSGVFLAEAVSKNGGILYTIESHKERIKLASETFKKAGLEAYIKLIQGHAPEIIKEVFKDNSKVTFDMVFIDATKMEYGSYLEAVLPLLRSGGVIVGDNFLSHYKRMQPFIEHVKNHKELQGHLLPIDSGLLFCIKG
jgi:predicted O-methyltransferase YrrM